MLVVYISSQVDLTKDNVVLEYMQTFEVMEYHLQIIRMPKIDIKSGSTIHTPVLQPDSYFRQYPSRNGGEHW